MKVFEKQFIVSLLLLLVISCNRSDVLNTEKTNPESTAQTEVEMSSSEFESQVQEDQLVVVPKGMESLVDIQKVDPSILVELKYATEDNFMKRVLYHDIKQVYLQKDVAERLSKCQTYLKKLHPEYTLLVYDGARPLHVQQQMWDGLDTIPVVERTKFVSNPANGSIHNYGAAVDLTICDENKIPLDMGAGYDDIRKIAYPRLEAQFLASGELTEKHIENRELLRTVMASQKFTNIATEWWHFNACSRVKAKELYAIIQ